MAESGRGLAPATVAAGVNALRTFFRWLVAEDELAADPSATLRSPRSNRTRIDVYSPAEAEAILAHTATLTDLRGRQRHANIVSTMIYTHLDVDDVRRSLDKVFHG